MPNHCPRPNRTAPDGRFQTKKWPQLSAQPERLVRARRSGTARREWFAPLDVEMVVVERAPELAVGRYAMIAIPPKKSIKPTADPATVCDRECGRVSAGAQTPRRRIESNEERRVRRADVNDPRRGFRAECVRDAVRDEVGLERHSFCDLDRQESVTAPRVSCLGLCLADTFDRSGSNSMYVVW